MQLRPLGRSGLSVAPLAFGGNVFGWTADEATSLGLLDAFVDDGFNLIDTADVYSRWIKGHSGGESETVIGRWLKKSGKRNRIVLATKVGMDMGDGKVGLAPAYIRQAVDDSLRRLQTDHIDLYQAHEDDPKTPLEETLGSFGDLIREGKVRAIGASNYSAARLDEALQTSAKLKLPRYESMQPLYNLVERPARGTGRCTAAGQLLPGWPAVLSPANTAAKPIQQEPAQQHRQEVPNERGRRVLDALIAPRRSTRPRPRRWRWQMARPGLTAPIASATSLPQWKELAGAARLSLDADTIAAIDTASR
jgi:aryl-alcohol dehydrogenase-like predicted oxidoreductase